MQNSLLHQTQPIEREPLRTISFQSYSNNVCLQNPHIQPTTQAKRRPLQTISSHTYGTTSNIDYGLLQNSKRSLDQNEIPQENKKIRLYESISPVTVVEGSNIEENIIPQEIIDEFFCTPFI